MNNKIIYGVIVLILLVGAGWFFWHQSSVKKEKAAQEQAQAQKDKDAEQATADAKAADQANQNNQSSDSNTCNRTFNNSDLTKVTVNKTDKFVTMSVEGFGDIKIQVDKVSAPKTSENFLKLAKAGFYDCLTFHRIAKGFVIQGGDPSGDGSGGPGYTIPAEIKLKHIKYSVAMARTSDQVNPQRDSSGSQFYISLDALPSLDGQYTVFGQVVAGMDVVDKIGNLPVQGGASDGSPEQKVVITKAVVSEK